MSESLKQFYSELWAWIQDGFPNHSIFKVGRDLCSSLDHWAFNSLKVEELGDIAVENAILLADNVCKPLCPFNDDKDDWFTEVKEETLYKNQKRLQFIKKMQE